MPRKNILPIAGKPMILHVIDHLLVTKNLSGIAISTDDDETIKLVQNHSDKIQVLGKRSEELSADSCTFMDLVNYDIERFARYFNDFDVLFIFATSILVTSQYYDQCIETFVKCSKGLLMSVTENHQSPFLSFVSKGVGIEPLFPDKFLLPTKDLPLTYFDCGCFYAFNLALMKGLEKFLDLTPITPLVLSRNMGIDVDNFSDIEKLNEILGMR